MQLSLKSGHSCAKRKRVTESQVRDYLERLRQLPIRVERNDLWANVDLQARAREWNLAAYDAAYFDLALRKQVPIASLDEGLRTAAIAEGVELLA